MFVLATFMCFFLVLFDHVLILFKNLGFKVCDSPMSLLALVVESRFIFQCVIYGSFHLTEEVTSSVPE